MPSSVERVFGTYELVELILLKLGCPVQITRAQRVCRYWRHVIRTSLTLAKACWYLPHDKISDRYTYKLNPMFNSIGITPLVGTISMHGDIDFFECFYNNPGPWKNMLATQPPCKRMEIIYCGRWGLHGELVYTIESTKDYLLMGDVMVILEQIGRRREGCEALTHPLVRRNLVSLRVDESHFLHKDCDSMSQIIPDDAAIKVLVNDAEERIGPAFSLQRYCLVTNLGESAGGTNMHFRDLTSHQVIHYDKNLYLQDGSLQISHIRTC